MMLAALPLVVSLVGAVFYFASKDGRWQEVGRLAYVAGLLAFLLANAGRVVQLP